MMSDLNAIGNRDLLNRKNKVAFFCSNKCSGDIILKSQDWATNLIGTDILPIGGFHTPVEKEVLRIIIKANHPVIIFPARSIANMRMPIAWKHGLETGKICVVSNFGSSADRITSSNSERRNIEVVNFADKCLFAYIAKGGKTEALKNLTINRGVPILEF